MIETNQINTISSTQQQQSSNDKKRTKKSARYSSVEDFWQEYQNEKIEAIQAGLENQ